MTNADLNKPLLTKAESKWLAELKLLMNACPSERLEAHTDGGNNLVIFYKDILKDWDSTHNGRRYKDWDLQKQIKESGSIIMQFSTKISITHG